MSKARWPDPSEPRIKADAAAALLRRALPPPLSSRIVHVTFYPRDGNWTVLVMGEGKHPAWTDVRTIRFEHKEGWPTPDVIAYLALVM